MASFNDTVDSLRRRFQQANQPLPPVTLGAINRDGILPTSFILSLSTAYLTLTPCNPGSFHYAKSFGEQADNPTDNDTLYWLASATKFITTIAVMQCVERGQLDLTEDISRVLPEFKDPQILTGYNENDDAIFKPATKTITLRQAEKFPHQFLVFEPGEQWMYSPGIDWAGIMVERITSMKLGEYMQRYIFDVVSVKDVTFHPEQREDLRARKAKTWELGSQGLEEKPGPPFPGIIEGDFGGGGLHATVNDLLIIYQGVLLGKLLQPETVKEMFQPQLENIKGLDKPHEYSTGYLNSIWNAVPAEVPVNFGIGGLINTETVPKGRGVHSLTWSGYPNCYWWMDINNGIAGVYLSQLIPSGDPNSIELLTEFEKFVYSSLES
ncbi:hypothetical protein IFR05_001330 [Cadophora sp. M221]|nr:hypothetical protein IFR05_001330 [Cadophora sp. M221]